MEPISKQPLSLRLRNFFIALTLIMVFVYGVLPLVTQNVPILARMSDHLSSNGIDPSRYYYTDVEQVSEGEHYIENALRK